METAGVAQNCNNSDKVKILFRILRNPSLIQNRIL